MVQNVDVVLKRFEQPDEVRTFEKGKFEIVRIGGMTIGAYIRRPLQRCLHTTARVGPSLASTGGST